MIMNSPEPMNLGSPSQSPGVGSNQYMPQFLLGDMTSSTQNMNLNSRNHQQSSGSKYWMGNSSPPRSGSTSNFNRQSSGGYSLSNGYDSKLNNSNLIDRSESNPNFHMHYGRQNDQNYSPYLERSLASTTIMGGNIHGNQHMPDKGSSNQLPGAPPVNRLVDIISNNKSYSSSLNNSAHITPNMKQEYISSLENKNDLSFTPSSNQHRLSPPSPTQVDPFYTYGDSIKVDDKLDETWITVFGFPQSATSFVLQEFSVYGQIIRNIPNPQGNWLHIQYQTKLQAQKAISKNGKILANSLMVGVMPCIDKRVMSLNPQQNDSQFSLPSTPGCGKSPTNNNLKTSASFRNFPNATKLDRTQSLRTNVRPLGPYNGQRGEPGYSATTEENKLPKKNANAISKAMEYMFGW